MKRISSTLRGSIVSALQLALLPALLASPAFAEGLGLPDDCGTMVDVDNVVNTTWTVAGSPYCVMRDCAVSLLTIQPGVTVKVAAGKRIEVLSMTAIGTEELPITFTAQDVQASWQGLHFQDVGSSSNLTYCIVEYANTSGIRIINSTPVLRSCTIRDNTNADKGGGLNIALAGGDLVLEDCLITNNSATYRGGGIEAVTGSGRLILDGCRVTSNTTNPARYRGSFYAGGMYVSGPALLRRSLLEGNHALTRADIYGGAAAYGGGILSAVGPLEMDNCRIVGNVVDAQNNWNGAYAYGGGWYSASGNASISNCVFGCNTAGGGSGSYGGGLYMAADSDTTTLVNCTIARNNVHGIYAAGGSVDVRNSILYFNNSSGDQIVGTPIINYSDVQGATVYTGEGNINLSPFFAAPSDCAEEGLAILLGSPCIDAGDPSGAYDDLCFPPSLGTARNDMGARGGPLACESNEGPLPPTGLAALSQSNRITLSWSPVTEGNLARYRIHRGTTPGAETAIDSVDAGTETFADTQVSAGTRYYYRLKSVGGTGLTSSFSTEVCATPADASPPAAPAALTARVVASGVQLGWSPSEDCDVVGYRIYRRVPPSDFALLADVSTSPTALLDTTAVAGSTFCYQVASIDNAGNEGAPATEACATPPMADLALTMSLDDARPDVGAQITYVLTLRNEGPDEATSVEVTDRQPQGLTFTSVTPSAGAGAYADSVWTVGDLAPEETATLTIVARVDLAGAITNAARISAGDPPDPDSDNDAASQTLISREADLVLAQSVDDSNPDLGEQVTFRLRVWNAGPDRATNIVIVDPAPTGLTFDQTTASGSGTYSGGNWNLRSLAAGDSASLTILATVTRPNPITNTAMIVAAEPSDPNPDNNTASATINIPGADLRVEQAVDEPIPSIGSEVTFTVTVTNLGPAGATGLHITDPAPVGLAFTAITPSIGSYAEGVWTIGDLARDASATLSITATVNQLPATNRATAILSDPHDPDPNNNTASATVSESLADLALTKTVDNPTPLEGGTVVFNLTLTNHGPSSAGAIAVTDAALPGVNFTQVTPSAGGSYDEATGVWSLASLASASAATLTIAATVDQVGSFTNTATITGADVGDPTPGNNQSAAALTVGSVADLGLVHVAEPDTAAVNSVAAFTLTVTNHGPSSATDIVISDALPSGLIVQGIAASLGGYNGGTWNIPILVRGATATLTIAVLGSQESVLTSTASIVSLGQSDTTPENNIGIASLTLTSPPTISLGALAIADEGAPVTVGATITHGSAVAGATLYYRRGSQTSFVSTAMEAVDATTYEATIPGTAVTAEGICAYVAATDIGGDRAQSKTFSVLVATAGVASDTPQPNGTAQTAYRLISVPLELDDASASAVLEDDLGPYGSTAWRLFSLRANQTYIEYPNTAPMTPGRGFWLAVSQAGKRIDTGNGHSLPVSGPHAIDLHPGWNFVGNPFAFPVPLSSVEMESSQPLDIQQYLGDWDEIGAGDYFTPFHGYALWVDDPLGDRLLVDPDLSTPRAMRSGVTAAPAWSIRIAAGIQEARDANNLAAVSAAASPGWDPLDRPEPPVIGDFVSLCFPHPEWRGRALRFRSDVRPEPADGEIWDLAVRSNIEDRLTLSFTGLAGVPPEFQIWLIDPALGIRHDLRADESYQYANSGGDEPRLLQLVVGRAEFVGEALADRVPQPSRAVLLAGSPNPFGQLTTIRFGLPAPERVTLRIFDISGRLVTTLLAAEPRPAGYHAVVWNGRDARGWPIASGVYLYQLNTPGTTLTERIVHLK